MKALQKAIVTSAAYRQASKVTAEEFEADPENRLIARGPRLRLPAQMIRDQALAVSGLLAERLGGPSVKPYQPEGLWADMVEGGYGDYVQSEGDDLYRRSLYTFWKRTLGPADADDVRLVHPRDLHRAHRPHEHAAAGAEPDERRDVRRSGPAGSPSG